MVLDTSALVAILFREPGSAELEAKIENADIVLVGAPTLFETSMILERESDGRANLADLLRATGTTVVAFTEEHQASALSAFVRFGKGRHPARLNILDCMSYAIADVAHLPLLYTGNDFSKTDIEAA